MQLTMAIQQYKWEQCTTAMDNDADDQPLFHSDKLFLKNKNEIIERNVGMKNWFKKKNYYN